MTETARLADYVLPTPVGYEKWETSAFPRGVPEIYMQIRPPVVPPPPDALPEPEIYVRLCEAMGLYGTPPAELHTLAKEALTPEGAMAFLATAQGAARGGEHETLVWAYRALGPHLPSPSLAAMFLIAHLNAMFRTESVLRTLGPDWEGKMPPEIGTELFRRFLAHPEGVETARQRLETTLEDHLGFADGRIRLAPEAMMPEIRRAIATEPAVDPQFPLVLAAGLRTRWTANTIQRDPAWRKGKGPHCALNLSPHDASGLGVRAGDPGLVSASRGSLTLPAQIDAELMAGERRAARRARPRHRRRVRAPARSHPHPRDDGRRPRGRFPSCQPAQARRRGAGRLPADRGRAGRRANRGAGDAVSRAVVCSAVAALCLATACHKPIRPGDPLRGLTREQRDRFARGKAVFDRTFKPETGLGPLFNSTGCGECHANPKAGGRGDEVEVHATAFRAKVCDPLVQEGGFVIQQHTTPALKQALGIDQEPFPPSATARATRTTAESFARGLLDLVPEADILAYADPDDRNHDGISGRPNHSVDGRLGRFGRQAFVPTLAEVNAGAFVAPMGITNPAEPTEENISGKPLPPGGDPVPDPETTQAAPDSAPDVVRALP